MVEGSLTARQRESLRRLMEAVRSTAAEERDLLARRDEATRGADARLETIRRTTMARTDLARNEAKSSFARQREAIEEESATLLLHLQQEWRSVVDSTEEKAARRVADAEKARQEAIWLAETVYEATSNQPQEVLEQTRKGLQGFREELDRVESEASAWIRACRQRPSAPPEAIDDGPGEAEVAAARAAGTLPSRPGLEHSTEEARELLVALRGLIAPRLFRSGLPAVLILVPALAAIAFAVWRFGSPLDEGGPGWTYAAGAAAGAALLTGLALVGLLILARRRVVAVHRPLLEATAAGCRAIERCEREALGLRDAQLAELIRRRDEDVGKAQRAHGPMLEEIERRRVLRRTDADSSYPARLEDAKREREERLVRCDRERDARLAGIEEERTSTIAAAEREHDEATAGARSEFAEAWARLRESWRATTSAAWAELERVRDLVATRFPSWQDAAWSDWSPPADFPDSIPFGSLRVDLAALEGGLPRHEDLALPCPPEFDVPALLDFPEQASLLVETAGAGLDASIPCLQAVMFRLLTSTPPGKVRFTIIDPVGLGQNFAGFMHLADDDGALVSDRIWTEDRHIDQRLLDITEHMENVIQKYLRNEYETIGRYNVDAGEIAEPYRFLVVANLPVNFSEAAARRINSVVASGSRCGVFTLVTADLRAPRPPGLNLDDLARASTTLRHPSAASGEGARANGAGDAGRFLVADPVYGPWALTLAPAPPEALLTRVLKDVGRAAKDASRVEVPFEIIAPGGTQSRSEPATTPRDWWKGDATDALRVGLGRAGATKIQHLTLGQGVSQHVLIAGKTGSGKSTLLHALITNTAMWFGPDEVEFYLIDFKKGVEFKTYASHDLPHARVVAIESDREFGLSVLQRLDAELRRRGELYRELGVQDLAGYRRECAARNGSGGLEKLPRTLLVIDEFQEFFTEDDKIAQDATLLLDRLVRQGRAFGIHVILGSQTLGGAYSLARATIGQMAVRIALQCTESDSYLILADDNAAARLLARPGEAIYNDQGGLIEGNNPFQIAWLGEETRDRYLGGVGELARDRGITRREPLIVFEGNVPAELSRNALLARAVAGDGDLPSGRGIAPMAWLGEAISIKEPTAAVFRRQSGANLLVIGQRDDAAVGLLVSGALGLLAQRRDARVWIFDALPPDAPEAGQLGRLAELLPQRAGAVAWREVPEVIASIQEELERRQQEEGPDAPPIFLVFAGLHRYRQLRQEDDFGFSASGDDGPRPDKQFGAILREGPMFGIHTLAWIDTVNNLNRTLDRQALKEFEQRVLFQMGQSDSSTMMDSPAASRLGLHRAIYFSEESGVTEKFRPYAVPPPEWLDEIAAAVRGSHAELRRPE